MSKLTKIFFLLFFLLTLTSTASAATTVYAVQYSSTVDNYMFENWSDDVPTSWSIFGTGGSRGDISIAGGDYSYKITGDGVTTSMGGISQITTLPEGGDYKIGAWIRSSGVTSGKLNIDIQGFNTDATGIQVSSNTGDEWVYYEATVYSNDNYPSLRIFADGKPNAGATWYVDGVFIAPLNPENQIESENTTTGALTLTLSEYISSSYPVDYVVFEFETYDISTRGKCSITATSDGSAINAYIQGEKMYVDTSTLSYNTIHSVIITVTPGEVVELISPGNGETFNFNYPPMYGDVNFIWEDVEGTTKIEIASDSSFVNIVYSEESADSSSLVSLPAGTYYWRVASYNFYTSSYGTYSSTYSVIVNPNVASVSGTGIMGTVYESTKIGERKYIPGAIVTIYNETFTTQKTTGSVGYYQITDLSEGTYYVTAEAEGYDDSVIAAVNVTSGNIITQNLAMQAEQSYFAPNYVTFIVKEKTFLGFKKPVVGASVTIYEDAGTSIIGSQVTGSDGAVGFELEQNIKYRIVVSYTGETQTEYITPTRSTYQIIWETDVENILPESQFYEVVNISIDKETVNSTIATIDISYTDNFSETNSAYFELYETLDNNTLLFLDRSITLNGNGSDSFTVTNYTGKTYTIKAYVDHESFGEVEKSFAVAFPGSVLPFTGKLIAYLAIIIMFFVGSMFGQGDIGNTGIIVSGLGWFFWYLELFESLGSSLNTTIGVGLIFATVLSVIFIFNEKRNESGI